MARTLSRPAVAGTVPVPSLDLLSDVLADARRTCAALAGVMELLQGCDPAHQVSTGSLLALLEPVAGGLDSVCGDLGTAAGRAAQ